MGLFYFKVLTDNNVSPTMSLSCICVELQPPTCSVPSSTCLNVKSNNNVTSIKLTKNILISQGVYNIVPYPQWQAIADLIESTFITTRLPIPLTPIPPSDDIKTIIQTQNILICDQRNTSLGTDTPLRMIVSDLTHPFSGYQLWSQYSYISTGTVETIPPTISVGPTFKTTIACPDASDASNVDSINWAIKLEDYTPTITGMPAFTPTGMEDAIANVTIYTTSDVEESFTLYYLSSRSGNGPDGYFSYGNSGTFTVPIGTNVMRILHQITLTNMDNLMLYFTSDEGFTIPIECSFTMTLRYNADNTAE